MHARCSDPEFLLGAYESFRDDHSYPFILETYDKLHPQNGHTYLGADPSFVVTIGDDGTYVDGKKVSGQKDPFSVLETLAKDTAEGTGLCGGFVGYVSYDSVHGIFGGKVCEPSVFCYYDSVTDYDHRTQGLTMRSPRNELPHELGKALRRPSDTEGETCSQIRCCDAGKQQFIQMVEEAKEYVRAGDVFQAVISREYEIDTDMDPYSFYRNLRELNPSPYMFLMEFDKTVAGASPETMAQVCGRDLTINPIAGTRPRDPDTDKETAEELLSDEKERSEHIMLVDLSRNDVSKVCDPVSISIPSLMKVRSYSHVHHIESTVRGTLMEGCSPYDAMRSAYPAGTLSGAPKRRAMEIIDEIEVSRRRVYGGCVGYFSATGDADLAIAIRMAEFDSTCRVRAGAGIVHDSDPEKEYSETEQKMGAVMRALDVEGCR